MNRTILIACLTAFVGIIIYTQTTPAFSIREFLGLEKPKTEQKTAESTPQKTVQKEDPDASRNTETGIPPAISYDLDFNEVQKILAVVDDNQRKELLADQKAFTNFITNEAANKSVLAAAHANKIDQNDHNLFIAQRGAENIIREIYLKQLITTKLPKDFPPEDQMQKYYDENKDKFVLEERVHVWQIFLPFKSPGDVKEAEQTKKLAESIITDLGKNTLDFASAAERYSQQTSGKYSGGYMGLVKVADLKPEIQKPLMALETDKISAPIKTAEGIHIMKRGTTVRAQSLRYDEVKDQIKKLFESQLLSQLRQAIYKQAGETYPIDINDKTIEEWRLKLRTNTGADKSATDQQAETAKPKAER